MNTLSKNQGPHKIQKGKSVDKKFIELLKAKVTNVNRECNK